MRSIFAALRTLVLPYGAITGPRIVLDGINGKILVYNAANVLVAELSANVGGGQGGAASYFGTQAAKLIQGALFLTDTVPDRFSEFNISYLKWTDDLGNVLELGPTADYKTLQVSGLVKSNGFYLTRVVAGTTNNTNSANITAEAITDSVTADLIAGRTYAVEWDGNINGGTVAPAVGDRFLARLRQDSLLGTIMDHNRVWIEGSGTVVQRKSSLLGYYTPAADETKDFVVTWARETGAGNIVRHASTAPNTRLSVLRVTEVT